MASDAHAHPWDLLRYFPASEQARRGLGALCAASAWNMEQFEYHEGLAEDAAVKGGPALALCFGVHPQLPLRAGGGEIRAGLGLLEKLAKEGRLDGVGETGFDFYNEGFKATEKAQEEIFAVHLEAAIAYNLPIVAHVRRAMSRVFAHAKKLKKLPAIVFHSYSGTMGEAETLLKRGINGYFSFGTPIMLNHRRAMECAALLPAGRLLFETDAPYQPPRGRAFSAWDDLALIRETASRLRTDAGSPCSAEGDLEAQTDSNFKTVFGSMARNACYMPHGSL